MTHRFEGNPKYPWFCRWCGSSPGERLQHIDEKAEAEALHAAHVLRTEDQMTELEKKVVARFREHGDRWFASLPDWRNTEIGVGEEEKISGAWIKTPEGKVLYPREYHHRLTISVDRVLEAHTILGVETVGDAVLVGVDVRADRKEDGPVWLLHGMRKYWDQIGWSLHVAMRTHDGHILENRYRGERTDVAEVRRARRMYQAHVPDGMDWDGDDVVRDPSPKDHDMADTRFSHIIRVYDGGMLLAFVREPVEVAVSAKLMKDGRWMLATSERMAAAIREYEVEAPERAAPIIEADPEAHLLSLF